MSIKVYDEPWSPSNIDCNWRPEKLARYSFVSNLIDYNSVGVQLGYLQKDSTPEANSNFNLTDYISVIAENYYFFYGGNFFRGIRYITFFDSNQNIIDYKQFHYNPSSVYIPGNCSYIRITIYTQSWGNINLMSDPVFNMIGDKNPNPLNIVENKTGELIYKDLHFEVYVKEEALIKNFVDCFDLSSFQEKSNISIKTYTPVLHNDINAALVVSKDINESNYNSNLGKYWVANVIYKNIWGCDMGNFLNTFVKPSNLCICYSKFFTENLRGLELNYNRFFDQGYFADAVIDYGARFFVGEKLDQDELLGNNKINNYFSYTEYTHGVPTNWAPASDNVVINDFGGDQNFLPFDHYTKFVPKIGMPFFKEKEFDDAYIQLTLRREDVLGNIFKRIVNLPVMFSFLNNLIKVYFTTSIDDPLHLDNIQHTYTAEYLNSNDEHNYNVVVTSTLANCLSRFTIWCPNISRLSLSSTIIGQRDVVEKPNISYKNGQLGTVKWQFKASASHAGETMRAVHTLEYSDGGNYDKFIYIENINIVASSN